MISALATSHVPTEKCNRMDGKRVTRITPHCMDGKLSGADCARYHVRSREASAQYYIGYRGDICSSVDECDRAWTSSSWDNDSQAITVEISNDANGSDRMTDDSIEAFIELCVDIAQRYGWQSVSYTGGTDGTITLHRWFASTSCPGEWLIGQLPSIVDQINARLRISEGNMWFVIKPRKESAECFLYADGDMRHLSSMDEWDAAARLYAKVRGEELPYVQDFGTKRADWGRRLFEALGFGELYSEWFGE